VAAAPTIVEPAEYAENANAQQRRLVKLGAILISQPQKAMLCAG
jgi:hypothetical protein